jgi:hypothetical protein
MNATRARRRTAAADMVTKLPLAAILAALVSLVVVIVWKGGGGSPDAKTSQESKAAAEKPGAERKESAPPGPKKKPAAESPVVVRPDQPVSRPPEAPPPPPTVGRADRIRDVLQEGKTYEVITTAELTGPVRDKDWGLERTVHLAYRAETQIRRTIEKNDGRRIVERRNIVAARLVKATSKVELGFVVTEPGVALLSALDTMLTGGEITALAAVVVAPFFRAAEGILQRQLDDENTKVKALLDSLSGKTVRITYEDGRGVVELQPVGCGLTEEERDFLFASAVVTDAFLLPDERSEPGDAWDVDGAAFADLLPPSWRGVPRGKISIKREQDFEENGRKYAMLRCYQGTLWVDATDHSRTRLASLTPRGEVKYNITAGHVESAVLTAKGSMEEASRDHLLFEARFETQPTVRLTYFCHIVEPR